VSQHKFLLNTAARGCSNVRPAGLMASQCRGDHGESPVAGLLYLRRFLLEELGGLATTPMTSHRPRMAGNSWGDWETKDNFIKDLQNKTNKWKSGNVSDLQLATFGSNTAVSHYTFTYDAELRGKHRARTVICSDTWVNDAGTWKTLSTHCSLVKGE
jgi:uncharacterized protein DUF4440